MDTSVWISTSKPIKEQTACQYCPDEAWTVNRRPWWKIKTSGGIVDDTSVVARDQQPRCQRRQITEHQSTRTRIRAVFNQMGLLLPTLQPSLFCCCRLINAVFLRQSDTEEVYLITNSVVFLLKLEVWPMTVKFWHTNGNTNEKCVKNNTNYIAENERVTS